jgi:3-hydroxybutyryl-CoA dehydrogenase
MRPAEQPIGVLGAGLMGSQIGVEFAFHGFECTFLDIDKQSAGKRIDQTMRWAVDLGLVSVDAAEEARRGIGIVDRVDELPRDIRFVVECLPENLETKVKTFRAVGTHLPDAVLGTNTSSLRVGDIGDRVGKPEHTVGVHYWNPPLLMPLVEVTAGEATSRHAVELATELLGLAEKIVIPVQRDVPGFIWNRLQFAVLREALWLVENGVASIDAVETVVRIGLARRWRHAGLFEGIYLGGANNWERIASNLFPVLSTASDANGLASRVVAASGKWVEAAQKRDEGLASEPFRYPSLSRETLAGAAGSLSRADSSGPAGAERPG